MVRYIIARHLAIPANRSANCRQVICVIPSVQTLFFLNIYLAYQTWQEVSLVCNVVPDPLNNHSFVRESAPQYDINYGRSSILT